MFGGTLALAELYRLQLKNTFGSSDYDAHDVKNCGYCKADRESDLQQWLWDNSSSPPIGDRNAE